MPRRSVISLRMTGLGDRIICLASAWRFARNTGRTLIADWRHGAYAPHGGENLFCRWFETPRTLAGVRFIASQRPLPLPRPRHPARWNDDALLQHPFLHPHRELFAERAAAVMLIRSGHDLPTPTVVFDGCINDGIVACAEAHRFLGALRPVAPIAEAAERFRTSQLPPGPVIGLHVRHGNGGDIMGHARHWDDFTSAIDRCRRAVARARAELGDAAPVLLCTDSIDVRNAVAAAVSGVICRDKWFRPPGRGELHAGPDAAAGRDDALIEMLLLARCEALIRYPPGSFFSFYPAVIKPSRAGLADTVYDLQQPCDPADPLAPALLV